MGRLKLAEGGCIRRRHVELVGKDTIEPNSRTGIRSIGCELERSPASLRTIGTLDDARFP